MVVSDTTANVKKCRAFICEAFPWILNCPDPCHQLNLLAKEIMLGSKKHPKIKGFAEVASRDRVALFEADMCFLLR